MYDMSNSWSWAQGSECFEQLRVMHDMIDLSSWARGSRWYEQLRVVDDMNDLGSHELNPLHDLNSSRLWMTWTTSGSELKALVELKDSELWAQGSRYYEQLRFVDDMNNLGSCELRPLDSMNSLGLWMTWTTLGHEHKALDAFNNLGYGWREWHRVVSSALKMLGTTQCYR